MTERKPIPTVPGPSEEYAAQFDALGVKAAQRGPFRAYLQGLLLPGDRNQTLIAWLGPGPSRMSSILECENSRTSYPSPLGTVEPLTPDPWGCLWADPSRRESSSSMTVGTAGPAPGPIMWPVSAWSPAPHRWSSRSY
jgi:hypothetical protein